MAGYSGTPLAQKLGIKPGSAVLLLGAPAEFEASLAGLPEDAKIARSARARAFYDVIVLFVTSLAELERRFDATRARMKENAGFWVAWPKKASGVKTDVTENLIRDRALVTDLVDNKVCAMDGTWSGLRLVIRVKDRKK